MDSLTRRMEEKYGSDKEKMEKAAKAFAVCSKLGKIDRNKVKEPTIM